MPSTSSARAIEKRAVIIPDGLGKTDFCARSVSLSRAPWESKSSLLADRPETAPRQPVILTQQPRRSVKGAALGAVMIQLIAEELRRPRDAHDPTEIII
ncbi:hypothetical protein [Thioclava sp. GXIMD4216]|uniref:hypothetical protein n=1 Tax=Thioclava sp. GXIMD4216 TaxID=3131929 RepID=UPI0030D3E986